jgi:hypothetical protein
MRFGFRHHGLELSTCGPDADAVLLRDVLQVLSARNPFCNPNFGSGQTEGLLQDDIDRVSVLVRIDEDENDRGLNQILR